MYQRPVRLAALILGILLATVAFAVLGWLLVPAVALALGLNWRRARDRLAERVPWIGRQSRARLVGLVGAGGLVLWACLFGIVAGPFARAGLERRASLEAGRLTVDASPVRPAPLPPPPLASPPQPSPEPSAVARPLPIGSAAPRFLASPVPSPTRPLLIVANAGAEGVSIRRVPATGERIKIWKDGARMESLGREQQAGGRTWINVRDPDGNEGWVATEFLRPVAAVGVPSPTPGGLSGAALGAARASPDVEQFVTYMVPRLQAADGAIETLRRQAGQAADDLAMLDDPTWQARSNGGMSSLRAAGEALQKYDPVPREIQSLDGILISIGKDLVFIADQFAVAVDTGSEKRLRSVQLHLELMTSRVQLAIAQLNSLSR